MTSVRLPTVIVPYEGPSAIEGFQDFFVYLRPETNGVRVESVLLKVIRGNALYRERISLVYLANLPGDFIVQNHIVEQHYASRLFFTRNGKYSFTRSMRKRFTEYFHVDFDFANILGAFEVVDKGMWSREELFGLWVEPKDLFDINRQTIKRIGDVFILNYDVPALLQKNSEVTDIAVMVFRSSLSYTDLQLLVCQMGEALIENEILQSSIPLSRAFHYSKGPFEQILDGLDYLYDSRGEPVPAATIGFCDYLVRRGVPLETAVGAVRHPIMEFRTADDEIKEEDLLVYTFGESYEGAHRKLLSAVAQPLLFESRTKW